MATTYVHGSTARQPAAPAATPAAADPQDSEGLHRALKAERQGRRDAETRLNRIRSEVQAELVKFSDRLHKLEQLMQRIAQTQVDQSAELREARELAALFRRGI